MYSTNGIFLIKASLHSLLQFVELQRRHIVILHTCVDTELMGWVIKRCKHCSISGPFAALMSYLAEVHDNTHRSRSYMWLGVFFSLANISLPCAYFNLGKSLNSWQCESTRVYHSTGIAWLVIPQKWNFAFPNETIEINSWRVFLAITSLPEFLACVALFVFPESPRFLILKGRHDEALNVLRKIYSLNTGKDPGTYPVIYARVTTLCSRPNR